MFKLFYNKIIVKNKHTKQNQKNNRLIFIKRYIFLDVYEIHLCNLY